MRTRQLLLCAGFGLLLGRLFAVDGNFTTVTATGSISAAGVVDADAGLTFGVQSGGAGATFAYTDDALPGGTYDTLKFSLNRISASWVWSHLNSSATTVSAMRLDSNHALKLFTSDGTAVAVALTPGTTSQLTLNSAILTGDSSGALSTNGPLTVAGDFTNTTGTVTGSTTTGLTLNAGGSGRNITLNSSGGDLIFKTNGTERARILANGKVGIGTNSPNEKLDVAGAVQVSGPSAGYTTATSVGMLDFASNGVRLLSFGADGSTRGKISFYTATQNNGGGDYRMVIDTTGYVGIGTTTPQAKLEVAGTIRSGGLAAWGSGQLQLQFNNQGDLANQRITELIAQNGNFQIRSVNDAYSEADSILLAKRKTGSFAIDSVNFPSGNVGIGTSSPAGRLHITGGSTDRVVLDCGIILSQKNTSGDVRNLLTHYGDDNVYLDSPDGKLHLRTNVDALVVDVGGNVGIGGAAPVTKLQLVGDNAEIGLSRSTVDGTAYTRIGTTTDFDTYWSSNATHGSGAWNYVATGGWGGLASRIDQANGSVSIDTVSGGINPITWNPRLLVANNGNVGIGTTSPSHKLAVNGTIRAKEVIVDTGWADYVFDESYRLAPLSEVEAHIKAEKHLPGVPSAREIAEHGVSMGEMQATLLSKIEELTLHLIKLEKENSELRDRVIKLESGR